MWQSVNSLDVLFINISLDTLHALPVAVIHNPVQLSPQISLVYTMIKVLPLLFT